MLGVRLGWCRSIRRSATGRSATGRSATGRGDMVFRQVLLLPLGGATQRLIEGCMSLALRFDEGALLTVECSAKRSNEPRAILALRIHRRHQPNDLAHSAIKLRDQSTRLGVIPPRSLILRFIQAPVGDGNEHCATPLI